MASRPDRRETHVNFTCPYCEATLCIPWIAVGQNDFWTCGVCRQRSAFRADPDRLFLQAVTDRTEPHEP